jgi:hypothetical protein
MRSLYGELWKIELRYFDAHVNLVGAEVPPSLKGLGRSPIAVARSVVPYHRQTPASNPADLRTAFGRKGP